MVEYKRNQVEAAISHLVEPKSPQPSQGLRTKLKRLLEADWTCPAFVESVFDFTLPALRTEGG
jgi:hypothetical protein